jgi:hypothetical protein
VVKEAASIRMVIVAIQVKINCQQYVGSRAVNAHQERVTVVLAVRIWVV